MRRGELRGRIDIAALCICGLLAVFLAVRAYRSEMRRARHLLTQARLTIDAVGSLVDSLTKGTDADMFACFAANTTYGAAALLDKVDEAVNAVVAKAMRKRARARR